MGVDDGHYVRLHTLPAEGVSAGHNAGHEVFGKAFEAYAAVEFGRLGCLQVAELLLKLAIFPVIFVLQL